MTSIQVARMLLDRIATERTKGLRFVVHDDWMRVHVSSSDPNEEDDKLDICRHEVDSMIWAMMCIFAENANIRRQ